MSDPKNEMQDLRDGTTDGGEVPVVLYRELPDGTLEPIPLPGDEGYEDEEE